MVIGAEQCSVILDGGWKGIIYNDAKEGKWNVLKAGLPVRQTIINPVPGVATEGGHVQLIHIHYPLSLLSPSFADDRKLFINPQKSWIQINVLTITLSFFTLIVNSYEFWNRAGRRFVDQISTTSYERQDYHPRSSRLGANFGWSQYSKFPGIVPKREFSVPK